MSLSLDSLLQNSFHFQEMDSLGHFMPHMALEAVGGILYTRPKQPAGRIGLKNEICRRIDGANPRS
jgi:hypothetical protein